MRTSGEVTAADIARLAGVGRAAVSNWRKRYADFPAPVGGSPASPTFRLDEVEQWLAATDRTPADEPHDRLRRALLRADDGQALGQVIPRLAEQLTKPTRGPSPRTDQLAVEIAQVAAEIGQQETFELLLASYVELGSGLPSAELAALLVELGNVRGRSVHDPACGVGALLAAAAAEGAAALSGQEADDDHALMARVRLTLNAPETPAHIRRGDLRDDAYAGEQFDVVLCHPPFASRDWGADELAYDPRWEFGVPPRQESELAWVQHALARTRPGGTAVIVIPPAVASRPSGRRIRAQLLRRGALRTVIALPPGMSPPAHLSLQVWVLHRPEVETASDVLVIDTSAMNHAGVTTTIRAPDDAPAHAARIPVVYLLDDEVDLTPARHLASRASTIVAADVLAGWDRLSTLVQALPAQLPALQPGTAEVLPMTTIADLIRTGALTLLSQPGTAITAGDVIVPSQGADLTAQVAAGPDTLAPNRVLLRPDPARLDPWFVAGFVARPSNIRLVSSLGSMMRLDIRRALVPRIPLDHQASYAMTFRTLHALRTNLINAAETGRKAIDAVAEGLAAGTVRSQA